jgi:hypothetical protein
MRRRAAAHAMRLLPKTAEMKDPSGDNRTVKLMGAWGGWALAPNTADGEGLPLHIDKSQHLARRSKRRADLTLCSGDCSQNHGAAGYFAAFAADLSDAIDGGESFSARLTEALSADGSSAGVFLRACWNRGKRHRRRRSPQ